MQRSRLEDSQHNNCASMPHTNHTHYNLNYAYSIEDEYIDEDRDRGGSRIDIAAKQFISEEDDYSPISLRLDAEDVYDKIEFAANTSGGEEDNNGGGMGNHLAAGGRQTSFNNIETILEAEEMMKESNSFDNPGFDINGEIVDHCFPHRKERGQFKERNLYENSFQVQLNLLHF